MDVTRLTDLGRGLQTRLRTFFDTPLEADATPLEIVQAMLDDVERHVAPVGRGRRVFPYTAIEVRVQASVDEAPRVEAVLVDLETRIRERLAEVQCEPVTALHVLTAVMADRPEAWTATQRFDVTYRREEAAVTAAVTDRGAATGPAQVLHVSVVKGTVADGPLVFQGGTISIGRSADPTDDVGRVRRNRIAFADEADGVNETVGRAHARLRYESSTGEYRLFDEGSRNGTSIARDGEVIVVPRRDPRGIRLRSGDEIHVGRAILRVELAPS